MKMSILQNRNRFLVCLFLLIAAMMCSCSLLYHSKSYETHESRFPETKQSSHIVPLDKTFKRNILLSNQSKVTPQKIENIHFGFGPQVYADPFVQDLNESRIDLRTYDSYKSISIFPKAQFSIDQKIKPLAIKTFSPLVDSIITRSKQQTSTQLIVQILVYGYADGIQISDQSPLYQSLRPFMKKVPMTKEHINRYLSYLRAIEIGKIISEIVDAKKASFDYFDRVYIQIVQEGKGDELPDTKKNYKTDDERRRVVKIFWKVV